MAWHGLLGEGGSREEGEARLPIPEGPSATEYILLSHYATPFHTPFLHRSRELLPLRTTTHYTTFAPSCLHIVTADLELSIPENVIR